MYGLEVWGNTYPTYLHDILLIQKKLVRIITFSQWNSPSEPLFRKLGILDIFKLLKLQLGIQNYHVFLRTFSPPLAIRIKQDRTSGMIYPSQNLDTKQENLQ